MRYRYWHWYWYSYRYISLAFCNCEKDKHFIKSPATGPNILKWLFMEIVKQQQQKKYTRLVSPEVSIILSPASKLWLINLTFSFQAMVWSHSDEKDLENGKIIFGLQQNNKNAEDAFDFYKVRNDFPFWLCDVKTFF